MTSAPSSQNSLPFEQSQQLQSLQAAISTLDSNSTEFQKHLEALEAKVNNLAHDAVFQKNGLDKELNSLKSKLESMRKSFIAHGNVSESLKSIKSDAESLTSKVSVLGSKHIAEMRKKSTIPGVQTGRLYFPQSQGSTDTTARQYKAKLEGRKIAEKPDKNQPSTGSTESVKSIRKMTKELPSFHDLNLNQVRTRLAGERPGSYIVHPYENGFCITYVKRRNPRTGQNLLMSSPKLKNLKEIKEAISKFSAELKTPVLRSPQAVQPQSDIKTAAAAPKSEKVSHLQPRKNVEKQQEIKTTASTAASASAANSQSSRKGLDLPYFHDINLDAAKERLAKEEKGSYLVCHAEGKGYEVVYLAKKDATNPQKNVYETFEVDSKDEVEELIDEFPTTLLKPIDADKTSAKEEHKGSGQSESKPHRWEAVRQTAASAAQEATTKTAESTPKKLEKLETLDYYFPSKTEVEKKLLEQTTASLVKQEAGTYFVRDAQSGGGYFTIVYVKEDGKTVGKNRILEKNGKISDEHSKKEYDTIKDYFLEHSKNYKKPFTKQETLSYFRNLDEASILRGLPKEKIGTFAAYPVDAPGWINISFVSPENIIQRYELLKDGDGKIYNKFEPMKKFDSIEKFVASKPKLKFPLL